MAVLKMNMIQISYLIKILVVLGFHLCVAAGEPDPVQIMHSNNKIFPVSIQTEVEEALSYYPELEKIHIEFKFRRKKMKSFMQAQPKFSSLLHRRSKRRYIIQISEKFNIDGKEFDVNHVPSEILIGWLGHELGHVYDYLDRSTINLIGFGANYIFSRSSIKTTERSADLNAILHGMGDYIFKTRNFILDHTELSEKYKKKIRKLYLSPPEILVLIEEHDKKEVKEILKSENPHKKIH